MNKTKKILVAHPLRDTNQLLEIFLQKMGHDGFIFLTTDGEKAKEFITENIKELLAVVVSDILPRLGGLGLAQLTKYLSQEKGLRVPVIIITSLSESLGRKHWEEIREISDGQLLEPFLISQFEVEFRKALAACSKALP